MEKLKEEVKTERFQRLAEQDRVIQSEQKRYTLEKSCEKLQGQNLRLSVKVEELQMKYEPGKCPNFTIIEVSLSMKRFEKRRDVLIGSVRVVGDVTLYVYFVTTQ